MEAARLNFWTACKAKETDGFFGVLWASRSLISDSDSGPFRGREALASERDLGFNGWLSGTLSCHDYFLECGRLRPSLTPATIFNSESGSADNTSHYKSKFESLGSDKTTNRCINMCTLIHLGRFNTMPHSRTESCIIFLKKTPPYRPGSNHKYRSPDPQGSHSIQLQRSVIPFTSD